MIKKLSLALLAFIILFSGMQLDFTQQFKDIIQPTQKALAASKSNYEVSSNSYLYSNIADSDNKHGKAFALKKDAEKTPKIVYDVYSQDKGTYHKAPSVQNMDVGRGKEDVLTFDGWSVIHFYYKHTSSNQKTYISVKNHNTGKITIYDTKQTSLSATDTLYYHGQKAWCSDKTFDEFDSKCNKKYDSVGFRAYIPVADLQDPDNPKKSIRFSMKIIKAVTRTGSDGAKHTRTWWDDLTVPYMSYNSDKKSNDLANLNYTLENTNSKDLRRAQVNKSTVMRLLQAGGDTRFAYFNMGRIYSVQDQVERSDRTAVYLEVKTPEESNALRYAASPFWVYPETASIFELTPEPYILYRKGYDKDRTTSSGGYKKIYDELDFDTRFSVYRYTPNYSYAPRTTDNSGAKLVNDEGNPLVPITTPVTGDHKKLSIIDVKHKELGDITYKLRELPIYYKTKSIKITRTHVDKATGDKLAKDEVSTVNVGDEYTYSPKEKITKDGKDYYPITATKTGKVGKRNKTITFQYQTKASNEVAMTIEHYDKDSKKVLLKETKFVKKSAAYSVTPKAKGYFKNSAGKLYEPVSAVPVTGTAGASDFTIKIPYKLSTDVDVEDGVTVTIKHVDKDSGKLLLTEKLQKPKDTTFQYPSKPSGYFEDSKGNPYNPVKDIVSITTKKVDITVQIDYTVTAGGDGGGIDLGTGEFSPGAAEGEFSWNLKKTSDTSAPVMVLKNSGTMKGRHFETRNQKYSIEGEDIDFNSSSSITKEVSNVEDLKDTSIKYTYSYEYTNSYEPILSCTKYDYDKEGNNLGCLTWKEVGRKPLWNYGKTAKWTASLKADHSYEEEVSVSSSDSDTLALTVGRKGKFNGMEGSSPKQSVQKERISFDADNLVLNTQQVKPVAEEITYASDLGNKLYANVEDSHYYPFNLDENLKDKYENDTEYNSSTYAIPMRVESKTSNSMKMVLADDFFVTKNTGLQVSLPHNEASQDRFADLAKSEYEGLFGATYDDEVLYTANKGSQFFIPIDGNDKDTKPNTWYFDNFVVGKVGLNDVIVEVQQKLRFNKYLLGNAKDNPVINEQHESIKNITYTNGFTIPKSNLEQLSALSLDRTALSHSFRSTDVYDKYQKIKELVEGLN
ncbi:hypothetical protein ACQKM9_17345 [Viridibacillus sp. NPDC093762]|uniref:hypothetical protein n=1 Tax=Viridibacillus sp. NPDC093762 TaxID=3390720 RepID=UPI003D08F7EC